jgi:preprotein translocase subunit SecD
MRKRRVRRAVASWRISVVTVIGVAAINLHGSASAHAQCRFEVITDRIQTTLLEVRLAETEPAVGLGAATVLKSDSKVYLHDVAVVTNNDVVQARVVERSGQFGIAITLTPGGAARMASATSGHLGRPLAIIVNGEVIAAPTVRGQIGNEALITGNFTRAEAEHLAAGLQR